MKSFARIILVSSLALAVARALVGAWLCRRLEDGTVMRRRITETEAYCGEDPHRHRLRLQARPKPQVAFYLQDDSPPCGGK